MDIISLLPDSVANQIAAGEVIQRPASVVKELLENAVDAGAGRIHLLVSGSGKSLIQVIDDGKGMSVVDARMSFERHATSKIISADDLFTLRSKGFRGEALASIAAIAHVELKSRQANDEVGTQIIIQGTKVISQEPCQTPVGSSFSIKNLFYNVPARRKFLKSDAVEMKHIIEEFQRVALAHPEIAFKLTKDGGTEVFDLLKGTFRQRVVGIFGKSYNERLVPMEEHTDVVKVSGFIGKPEYARKTKGQQYLFLNDRYIKSGYLHHAITRAYEDLLSEKVHPSYFLCLQIDPGRIDINIHPTKTEVKFEDEKAIYAILSSTVRQSLGRYNIAPSIDFEADTSFAVPPLGSERAIRMPEIKVDPNYNPFDTQTPRPASPTHAQGDPQPWSKDRVPDNWQDMYKVTQDFDARQGQRSDTLPQMEMQTTAETKPSSGPLMFQLQERYIMTTLRSGLVFIDQSRAHERVLYEQFIQALALNNGSSQQSLFPDTLDLSATDMALITEYMSDIRKLGFDIEPFGKQSIKINGVPADAMEMDASALLESWLEEFRLEQDGQRNKTELLARSLAKKVAIRPGHRMQIEEMQELVDRLFACEQPNVSPAGHAIIVNFGMEELNKKFGRS